LQNKHSKGHSNTIFILNENYFRTKIDKYILNLNIYMNTLFVYVYAW
jgi:hypothetical protein